MLSAKYLALAALVLQNSALILTMRFSRVKVPLQNQYLTSTAVVLSEMLKSVICFFLHLRGRHSEASNAEFSTQSTQPSRGLLSRLAQLFKEIYGSDAGFVKMIFPAALYTIQDNLQFIAASNLDPATHQVTYQGKILTTALFAVLLLGKRLSLFKWSALLLLTLGVACVQLPDLEPLKSVTVKKGANNGNQFLGMIAVGAACVTSGLAGVYFERVLKSAGAKAAPNTTKESSSTVQPSLWTRSLQLSTTSFAFAVVHAFIHDGQAIRKNGFLQGYSLDQNPAAIAAVCMQATCGLIVAVVIKYADNILKGFATSMSVVLSTVASVWLFDFVITKFFLIGASLVMIATWMYGMPDAKVAEYGQTSTSGSGYRDEESGASGGFEMKASRSPSGASHEGLSYRPSQDTKREH